MSKRLLFVTTRLPWPTNSGRRTSLYHYCRGLHEQYGYEVSLFAFPEWDQERSDRDKPPFVARVHLAAPIGRLTKLWGLLRAWFSGKPYQTALYESRKNHRLLQRVIAAEKPDVVLFDMLRLAPYMKVAKGHARCVLDLDDLLSVRYKRQLRTPNTSTGIAGHYAGEMSPLAERLLCHGRIGKMILKSEQKRVARAELRFAREAEGVVLVSAAEAAHLNRALGRPVAVTVPTGVDTTAFTPDNGAKKQNTFGFVGNLYAAANAASLTYIANEILPLLSVPFTFEVAGPCPDEVRTRLEGTQGLRFLGEVKDLAIVTAAWQFTLCPIAFGTGLKTKVLEAMAAGLPVLTNAVGAEGIGANNGSEIFVLEGADDLAAAAEMLLNSPALCREVGTAARHFVCTHYDWSVVFKAFGQLDL
ncbi:MAG: glycosyltransferase [Ruminococcaceae bacterium]|nr:glycosyltransferase [Oscillospiraceae bacterium]